MYPQKEVHPPKLALDAKHQRTEHATTSRCPVHRKLSHGQLQLSRCSLAYVAKPFGAGVKETDGLGPSAYLEMPTMDPQNTQTIPKSTPDHRNNETGSRAALLNKRQTFRLIGRFPLVLDTPLLSGNIITLPHTAWQLRRNQRSRLRTDFPCAHLTLLAQDAQRSACTGRAG